MQGNLEQKQSPQQIFNLVNIMWILFLVSIVMFSAIAYILNQRSGLQAEVKPFAEQFSNPMIVAIAIMALLNFGLVQILPKLLNPSGSRLSASKNFQIFIVRVVLIEAIALFGLVGAIITHQPLIAYTFGAVALLAHLMTKPNRGDFT